VDEAPALFKAHPFQALKDTAHSMSNSRDGKSHDEKGIICQLVLRRLRNKVTAARPINVGDQTMAFMVKKLQYE
jgi:hypothetical protein